MIVTTIERWAIYIDIQGFSALWEKEDAVLLSLGELMLAIVRIGRNCYPNSPDRIFAHQFGDGFLIISDFPEENLERCVNIAIALLRHVASSGRFAKAFIIEGQMTDIKNCYPTEVLNYLESDLTVSLSMGLMTIVPVMGTALIRGASLEKNSPSGPLLIIETSKIKRVPKELVLINTSDERVTSIDWVHFNSELLSKIQNQAKLQVPNELKIEESLRKYCKEHSLKDDWTQNVYRYLCIPRDETIL